MEPNELDGESDPPAVQGIYRYPGPRPFREGEHSVFFGRDREAEEIFHSIRQQQLTVLAGGSGVGKSSLLNASIFPLLANANFVILPVRAGALTIKSGTASSNFSAMDVIIDQFATVCQAKGYELVASKAPEDGENLWAYLKTLEVWRGDTLLTPVLVFDQFEEIFTIQSDRVRHDIIHHLAPLISREIPDEVRDRLRSGGRPPFSESPPDVKLVIGLRDEFVGKLQEFKPKIPGILDNVYLLRPLTYEQAVKAVTGPGYADEDGLRFKLPKFEWNSDELEALLKYLAIGDEVKAREWEAESKDAWKGYAEIEPFPLQIICSAVERDLEKIHLDHPDLPILTILPGFMGGEDGLNRKVKRYFDDAIASLGSRPRVAAAKALCAEGLLIQSGSFHRRVALPTAVIESDYGIGEMVLRIMEDRKILRRENIKQQDFWELSHDRLIQPVLSNRPRLTKAIKRRLWVGGTIAAVVVLGVSAIIANLSASTERYKTAAIEAEKQKVEAEIQKIKAQSDLNAKELAVSKARSEAELNAILANQAEEEKKKIAPLETAKGKAEQEREVLRAKLAARDSELASLQRQFDELKEVSVGLQSRIDTFSKEMSTPAPPAISDEDFRGIEAAWMRIAEKSRSIDYDSPPEVNPAEMLVAADDLVGEIAILASTLALLRAKSSTSKERDRINGDITRWHQEVEHAVRTLYLWSENAGDFSRWDKGSMRLEEAETILSTSSLPTGLNRFKLLTQALQAEADWWRGKVSAYRDRMAPHLDSELPKGDPGFGELRFARIWYRIRLDDGQLDIDQTDEAVSALDEMIAELAPAIRKLEEPSRHVMVRRLVEWGFARQEILMRRYEANQNGEFPNYPPGELDLAEQNLKLIHQWAEEFQVDDDLTSSRLRLENVKLLVRKAKDYEGARRLIADMSLDPPPRMVAFRLHSVEIDRWRALTTPANEAKARQEANEVALGALQALEADGMLPFDRRVWLKELYFANFNIRSDGTPNPGGLIGMPFVPVPGTRIEIAKFETRVLDYRRFVSDTKHSSAKPRVFRLVENKWIQSKDVQTSWEGLVNDYELGDDSPIVGVSFEDATAFCEWITQESRSKGRIKTPAFFRLPKDTEWKNAAVEDKNQNKKPFYPWGAERFPSRNNFENFGGLEMRDNQAEFQFPPKASDDIRDGGGYRDDFIFPAPVQSMEPNWLGLHHMGGNVREWVVGDRLNWPMIRGGSWVDSDVNSLQLNEAHITKDKTLRQDPAAGFAFVGFRIVYDPGK